MISGERRLAGTIAKRKIMSEEKKYNRVPKRKGDAINPEWVKYELRDDDLKKAYENYGRAMKQMNDVDARYFSKVIDKLEGVEDEVDSMKERAIDLIRRWQAAGESGISARLWVERNEFIKEIDGHDRT